MLIKIFINGYLKMVIFQVGYFFRSSVGVLINTYICLANYKSLLALIYFSLINGK